MGLLGLYFVRKLLLKVFLSLTINWKYEKCFVAVTAKLTQQFTPVSSCDTCGVFPQHRKQTKPWCYMLYFLLQNLSDRKMAKLTLANDADVAQEKLELLTPLA